MRPIELMLDSCRRVLPLLRSSALAERWSEPSALDQWTNAGLAGHLARSAFNLERALDRRCGNGGHIVDVAGYYAPAAPEPLDSPDNQRIRALGDAEAADGAVALATRFTTSITALQKRALPLDAATTIEMFNRVMAIDDCATACLLELVVHTDDLALSVGLEPPAFDEQAVDLVVASLARISRIRRGDSAVIRALARSERAPADGISAF